jgi:hypothetical protein
MTNDKSRLASDEDGDLSFVINHFSFVIWGNEGRSSYFGFSKLIIQLIPNWSTRVPNRAPQNVS